MSVRWNSKADGKRQRGGQEIKVRRLKIIPVEFSTCITLVTFITRLTCYLVLKQTPTNENISQCRTEPELVCKLHLTDNVRDSPSSHCFI